MHSNVMLRLHFMVQALKDPPLCSSTTEERCDLSMMHPVRFSLYKLLGIRPLSEDSTTPGADGKQFVSSAQTNEDNAQIFVMNNYFGLGLDADLCLDFHNARWGKMEAEGQNKVD
jgi:hypothetical protein